MGTEERYYAAQNAIRARLKKGRDVSWNDGLPTQSEIEKDLKGRTGYVEFCTDTEDASVRNLKITEQSSEFELVSQCGRWFVTGPSLKGLPGSLVGPPGSLEELHVFARIDGTINLGGHVLPKLRLLVLWNNDKYLVTEAEANAPGPNSH